jgi:MoCo/4Fe-4S cofactor protein with predicted Tat translocation signal
MSSNTNGKQYWRSLDELADSPKFHEWLHREFPENASEMLDGGSRRTMLKLMAASFGLAGLTACRRPVERILPNSLGVEDYIPGKSMFYATAYTQNGFASGLLVECHDGRPTKIEGNPKHPYSLGAASALAQGSLLNLYDPDRAKHVMEGGRKSTWEEFFKAAKQKLDATGGGAGVRILAESSTSPSLAALKKQVMTKYPQAKWVEYESLNRDEIVGGAQLAFGQPLETHYHFDKAAVVVTLDSDFLGIDEPTILPTKQFSKRRRILESSGEMNRLYAAESAYTITGAMADHRLRARTADIGLLASALAKEVGVGGELKVLQGNQPAYAKWVTAVAKDLKAHTGKSIVVAGPKQPAAVHALVHAINKQLGNFGETVTFTKIESFEPHVSGLKTLANEMAGSQVRVLLIIGGNPAYTAPTDFDFGANLKRVEFSAYLGEEVNETAASANWALPKTHFLEAWGDARAMDGTATVQQPMIEPLYEGKPAIEVLAVLADFKDKRPYDIVHNYWTEQWPAADRERKWRKALHEGTVEGTAYAEVKPASVAAAPALPAAPEGMEVVFRPSASLYDGRFANNPWLQETPDPITKLVWDNAAMVSPATAKSLNIVNGDVLTIQASGREVRMPAMIQPGHADNSVTVALGYGRTRCGHVGTGVGHNVGVIRTSTAFWYATGAKVTKTGDSYTLVTTQEHFSMEGRPLVLEAGLEEYKKTPEFVKERSEHEELFSLFEEHKYDKGNQWGMVIDLNTCIGCNACLVACIAENNIPVVGKEMVAKGREMHWIRLDRYYVGNSEDPQLVTQPINCQQCESAPCESVCPVAATIHSPEGLNDMAYNRCIGTRYCANNCPYKVRRFNFLDYHKDIQESTKMVHNPNVTVRMRGVMEKCNYCVQRIQETKIAAHADGRRPIRDGEVLTACQQTCPADAIVFGNILDPNSEVAKRKKQDTHYALLAELNTKPRTTFSAKLRNPNPELA